MHAAVVEDKVGICDGQASLFGFKIELHNLMITYKI